MRAFISISFLLLYSVANTELAELVKLPMLVHHYLEHKAADKRLTFAGFLKDHYEELHTTANNQHKKEHRQLPFKVHDHNCFENNSLIPLVCIHLETPGHSEAPPITGVTENCFFSHFLADIWQPPKA